MFINLLQHNSYMPTPIMFHKIDFGGTVMPQGTFSRGSGATLREEAARAKLSLLRKPLTESPFGGKDNHRLVAFKDAVVAALSVVNEWEAPDQTTIAKIVFDMVKPVNFQDVTPRSHPFEGIPFGL